MAALTLQQAMEKYHSGQTKTPAPSSGSPSRAPSNQSGSAAPSNSALQVQEFLIEHRLPVSQKTPWVADGQWGPISNGSLRAFIDTFTQPNSTPSYKQLAEKVKQFYSPDPRITAQNLDGVAAIFAAQFAETGKKPTQQPQKYYFDAVLNGQHYSVPLSQRAISSAGAFEAVLEGIGMIQLGSTGQERAAQIDAAARAVWAALPEDKYVGAKETILQLRDELVKSYTKPAQQHKSADQYIRANYGDLLAGVPKAQADAAVNQMITVLRGKRAVDFDGNITDESLMRGYDEAIRQRLTSILQNISRPVAR